MLPPDGHIRRVQRRRDYVQFTLHSSELMPGMSPNFPQQEDIEALYDDLEVIFRFPSSTPGT